MMFIFEANAPYIYISAVHSSKDTGKGGGAFAPLVFGKSVNPIPIMGQIMPTTLLLEPPPHLDFLTVRRL